MQKTKWEYVKEQLDYFKDDLRDYVINPLLGESAESIPEYFFALIVGIIIFFLVLLPANLIGIIEAITGYYKWLDEKRDGRLFPIDKEN